MADGTRIDDSAVIDRRAEKTAVYFMRPTPAA
jgi:hypothetical protein